MEMHQTGQTSLQLAFHEQSAAITHAPQPNRMDLRFLLNDAPALNVGFEQNMHILGMHSSNGHIKPTFESPYDDVGKTTRKIGRDYRGTYHGTIFSSPIPESSKSSPKAAMFLSPTVSNSPDLEFRTTTTPTTVEHTLPVRGDNQRNPKSYCGKAERMQRSIKQLRSVASSGSMRGNFSKRKAFPCDQCGFLFGMRSNLKRHVQTVHEDRRTFTCPICHSAFGLKQNLATHIRVKHEKQRPFQCDICNQSFGYKQVLQNHRRNIHHV